MYNSRFIKFIPCTESDFLRENHPNAFLLLSLIAERARRTSNHPDGLQIGEAHIGDFKKAGIETRQKYRTALQILISRKHVQKMETCRTRQKSTTGTTTEGTKIKLLRSDVWDINPEYQNNIIHHPSTTEQPPSNHEQERTRKKKKETTTTRAPLQKVEALNESDIVVVVDFSQKNLEQEEDVMYTPPDEKIPISIHPSLKDLSVVIANESHSLPLESQISFTKEFSSDSIERGVQFIKSYKNPISNLGGLLRKAMQNNYEVVKSREDKKKDFETERENLQTQQQKKIDCNRQLAKSYEEFKSSTHEIRISSESVTFHDLKGNKHFYLSFREFGFIDQFDLLMRKCGINRFSKIDDNGSNFLIAASR